MLRKVVRPDKSAVIFKYDGLGRRIEKSITRAGSERETPLATQEAAWKDSKWETIGGVRIRRPNTELQKPHTQQDPIGLADGNPTLYGYVCDTNIQIDELGLSWSDVLKNLGIVQPEGLTKPHGHHIVFKGNFDNDIRGIPVKASQAILERFNIDINDPANLMWASNTKGVHTFENAQMVLERLESMEKKLNNELADGLISPELAQQRMKQELQSVGKDVFSCY